MKILVLDDEPRAASRIINPLEALGYQVDYVTTSDEAFAKLNLSEKPDLCFFDFTLEGDKVANGSVVARKFVQEHHIPVIIYSRHSNEGEYAKQARDAGVPHRFFMDRNTAENKVQLQSLIQDALDAYELATPTQFEYLNYASRVIGLPDSRHGERQKRFVKKQEIMFLEGDDGYTKIHLEDEEVMIARNIGNVGGKINRVFYNIVRVDRSYYFNLEQIRSMEGSTLFFSNGKSVRLSEAAKAFLRGKNLVLDAQ